MDAAGYIIVALSANFAIGVFALCAASEDRYKLAIAAVMLMFIVDIVLFFFIKG